MKELQRVYSLQFCVLRTQAYMCSVSPGTPSRPNSLSCLILLDPVNLGQIVLDSSCVVTGIWEDSGTFSMNHSILLLLYPQAL